MSEGMDKLMEGIFLANKIPHYDELEKLAILAGKREEFVEAISAAFIEGFEAASTVPELTEEGNADMRRLRLR